MIDITPTVTYLDGAFRDTSLRVTRINVHGMKVPVTLDYDAEAGTFKVTPVDYSLNDRQVLQ
ncbi:hypothetical protein PBI_MANDA_2 [Mycobacterium phage Manda]|nr:hypothetical protein PBI_MANDA_2 [Mycobacterium phage Manda]